MQTTKFPSESAAASSLEALHAATTFALVCDNATSTDLWTVASSIGEQPVMEVAAQRQAELLLKMDLTLRTVEGSPERPRQYGLALYNAEETLPALFDKLRCALQLHAAVYVTACAGSRTTRQSRVSNTSVRLLICYPSSIAHRCMCCVLMHFRVE